MRGDKVVRALERAGFEIARVRGSHFVMKHPDGRSVPVPVHSGQDMPRGTFRSIATIAQIAVEDLIELL
ncbi:type II toxin-antitoxin system HicA family toxin [Nocardia mexicana]|uniref:type II toxin-antitoxin system HicA family toxin n=1 Tax=Nocardia mexicana TaxID=279262 RepID=UPI000B137585|nr:type II toxin-antitoxin system HicA family toxin [Nocardia mexicana]